MQIIIIGAGQAGTTLAASLVAEHNVTVVDLQNERLQKLQAAFDLLTIQGYGSHPRVLAEAGAAAADMLIAVTNNDEINMAACLVADNVFKISLKIARIRASDYFLNNGKFFAAEKSPIDVFINPGGLITQTIEHLIEYPGALRIFNFADESVKLVATKPSSASPMLGKTAADLKKLLPRTAAKLIAIYRQDKILPLQDTLICENDDVIFIAENSHIAAVLNLFYAHPYSEREHKRVMIIGGGFIGSQLAQMLEKKHQIKIIEQDLDRCQQLAQQFEKTLILHGNGCDPALLRSEEIENIDCFCALTNSDTDNIVSALYSKQLGAKQVIALVNSDAYLNLIISGYIHIDIAVSPQQITVSTVLKHLRQGQILQAYSLRRGAAEALEIKVGTHAQAVNNSLATLNLPKGAQVCGIIRNHSFIIPDAEEIIRDLDRVILYISDKSKMNEVEKLFVGEVTK